MRPSLSIWIITTKVSQMGCMTIRFIRVYVLPCSCFTTAVLSVALDGALQITRNSFSVFAMARCVFIGLSVYVLLPCHRKALGAWPFDRVLQAESARFLALEHAWPCSCWHHCSWQRGWAMLQRSRICFHAEGS